jgi:RNA recognition motif-containing protein
MNDQNCNNNNHTTVDVDFSSSDSSLKSGETNLIANYLPQAFTCQELRILFAKYGEIRNCKLVYDRLSGESLCFGFVNFVRSDDAVRAICELNGCKIVNKHIKVSYARPSSESIKNTNLYVCGIPKYWSLDDLNLYFGQCGKIITSRILVHENKKSKGVGFVRFDQRYESDLGEFSFPIPN